MSKQKTHPRTDYVFDVPLDVAATITGYRHDRAVQNDFFRNLRSLAPKSGLWSIATSRRDTGR
jgi:hypothetical protein